MSKEGKKKCNASPVFIIFPIAAGFKSSVQVVKAVVFHVNDHYMVYLFDTGFKIAWVLTVTAAKREADKGQAKHICS
jgi:hypothetical protein